MVDLGSKHPWTDASGLPRTDDRARGILSSIGNTPLIELPNLCGNPRIRLWGKMEAFNPGGSVKDRPAYNMIVKAEESGELTSGKTILEPTSGNTGIALAMIGATKGYRVKLFMPECVSEERRRILEAYGAEVVLTPGKEGTDGAIRRAYQAAEQSPELYYMPNQFENENNMLAHYTTTGPEILSQSGGDIDVFVAGMGTTGTLMGVGRYLRERKPGVRIVGVEPTRGHSIQGLKNMTEAIVPKLYDPDGMDEKLVVPDEEAFEATRTLVAREGLLMGMSSGAALVGALRVAAGIRSGSIVVLFPDRGDRYLSTSLFRSVCGRCPP